MAEHEKLEDYRKSIDNIDAAVIFLLAERFRVTENVGRYKRNHNLPPADATREEQQVARLKELAAASGLDSAFIRGFFTYITADVKKRHDEIRKR